MLDMPVDSPDIPFDTPDIPADSPDIPINALDKQFAIAIPPKGYDAFNFF
jgi:hypothetical protein